MNTSIEQFYYISTWEYTGNNQCARISRAKSSQRRCSVKKGVLKFFQNLQENTHVEVFFFIKPATLLKKRQSHRSFSKDFIKFLKDVFYRIIQNDYFE